MEGRDSCIAQPRVYRALYDFTSAEANVLTFVRDDVFVVIDGIDGNGNAAGGGGDDGGGWLWALDYGLQWGFIPATYVVEVRFHSDCKTMAPTSKKHVEEMLHSLISGTEDKMMKEIILEFQKEFMMVMNSSVRVASSQLVKHADEAVEEDQFCVKEPILSTREVTSKLQSVILDDNAAEMGQGECEPLTDRLSEKTVMSCTGCKWWPTEGFKPEMIEHVKTSSSLTHKQAKAAVEAALEFLSLRVVHLKNAFMAVMADASEALPTFMETMQDWQRLNSMFAAIANLVSDVEQLNWAIHEDLHMILSTLEDLTLILTEGDPMLCKAFLHRHGHHCVEILVQYYQMESRQVVRRYLLKVFGALCGIERLVISILVTTDLTILLAKDIKEGNQDVSALAYACSILSMLMWTGEALPIRHYDILNMEFCNCLVEMVENPPSEDDAEHLQDEFIKLLLTYNLQFTDPHTNVVLQSLVSRSTSPEFLRKLIMLANREDDPVGNMFDYDPCPPNSVHKMLFDMFTSCESASLFYTNDLKVLIEIVVRKLKDLPPGDAIRTAYLLLASGIIKTTNYADYLHCQNELQDSFTVIVSEDSVASEEDKNIIDDICSRFPSLFHC